MLRDEARPPTGMPCIPRYLNLGRGKRIYIDISSIPFPDIEIYFSRCFGLAFLTIAVLTVLLTGSIPLTATIAESVSTEETDPKAPYAVPTLLLTSLFHAACASHDYAWYSVNGQTALAIGMVASGVLGFVGLWCLLFASSRGRISKRTGADKRTSGFPFKNAEAEKRFAGKTKGL